MTDQSFGALAARTVERGLIERVPGPGRAVRHRLTEKGLELRVAGEKVVDDILVRSLAALTPEQLQAFDVGSASQLIVERSGERVA